jgi:hypothetical protein
VLSAFLNRFVFVFTLALISVINSGCRDNSADHKDAGFAYAEIHAQVVEVGRESMIKRRLYISPDGNKAVFSEIRSESGLSSYKTTTLRFLSEYREKDSVFMYDSGDSTCVALAVSDLAEAEIYSFPFSAAWLLYYKGNTSDSIKTDTSTFAGYLSRKHTVVDGYIWMHGDQPLAIELNKNGNIRSERITKYKTDTIFSEGLFRHPLGFSRLVASD